MHRSYAPACRERCVRKSAGRDQCVPGLSTQHSSLLGKQAPPEDLAIALELAVHRYDSSTRHLVLRRRQEHDRRRDFLDLRPSIEIRLRSEEHTSELQSRSDLVCRLLLEKKKNNRQQTKHLIISDRSYVSARTKV